MPSRKSAFGTSPCSPDFMEKYKIMTPEIEEIDKTIVLLKSQRQKLVAKEAKKKADQLCAEMRKRKQSK